MKEKALTTASVWCSALKSCENMERSNRHLMDVCSKCGEDSREGEALDPAESTPRCSGQTNLDQRLRQDARRFTFVTFGFFGD